LADPLLWNSEEVAVFLETLNLDSMAEMSFVCKIDGSTLLNMTQSQMEMAGVPHSDALVTTHLIAHMKSDPGYASRIMMDFRFADKIMPEGPIVPIPDTTLQIQEKSPHYSGPSEVVNLAAPRNLDIWRTAPVCLVTNIFSITSLSA
jgi:hypothetical protein